MPVRGEPPIDQAHDVLAAEEFAVPAPDPVLHRRSEAVPHDVLAAEEFAVPAPDPVLHQVRIVPPPDPSGIEEPHDVLAAEEFALPAGPARRKSSAGDGSARGGASRRRLLAAGLVFGLIAVRRRRS